MHTGQFGTGFTDTELQSWADRIREYLAGGIETYIYFNNDPGGHAIWDSRRLREMLAARESG